MTHTIIIHPMGDDDYPDYDIHCPGVSQSCETWYECDKCRDLTDDEQDEFDQTGALHGVEHQSLDFGLSVASDPPECFLFNAFEIEFEINLWRFCPGTYPIDFEIEESYVMVDVLAPRHRIFHGKSDWRKGW